MQQIIYKKFLHLLVMMTLFFCMLATPHLYAASYNSKTGELFLPSLVNGSSTLTDVTLTLNPDSTFEIQSGTQSALPFRCSAVFSEATLDLLKSAKSSDEIDALLGCRWVVKLKQLLTIANIPDQNNLSFTWRDSKCSLLEFSFGEAAGINLTTSKLTKNEADCKITSKIRVQNQLYDLQSNLFLLSSVSVDNNAIASDVLIKFQNNTYELINFSITNRANPPVICPALSEADFDAVSINMTKDDVSNIVGCQWINQVITDPSTPAFYSWRDHECNELFVGGGIKQIILNKSGGCHSFGAQ